MIQMNIAEGVERCLKTLLPQISRATVHSTARQYQIYPNTFFINISLKWWSYLFCGLVHWMTRKKVEQILNIYGLPNYKYYVNFE